MRCKKYAVLQKIDDDHPIRMDMDCKFYYHLQHCLLLALKEQGIFNELEHRYAQEQLATQQYKHTRTLLKQGGGDI